MSKGSGVAEVVVPPRSGLVGEAVFPGMTTESGDLVVPAIRRKDEELAGETTIAVGDTLLLQAWHRSRDLVVLNEPTARERPPGRSNVGPDIANREAR